MNKKTNKARDAGTNENLLAKTICILHGTLWDREDRFSDVKRAEQKASRHAECMLQPNFNYNAWEL